MSARTARVFYPDWRFSNSASAFRLAPYIAVPAIVVERAMTRKH